jgi:hypothetical protein
MAGATPILPQHKVVLIRINKLYRTGMSAQELYEATRKWWVAAENRRDGGLSSPEWAFALYQGKVKAVFKIRNWAPPTIADIKLDPKIDGRWGFAGVRDHTMESHYLEQDLSSLFPRGSANPIRYINC